MNTAQANDNLRRSLEPIPGTQDTDSVAQQDVDNALGSERANAATW